MIDRDTYFDSVRGSLFAGALEQVHVDGQSVILAVWDYQAGGTPMSDLRWLAYMLATVYNASKALSLIDDRDLVDHPEMALDSLIATRILFRGMAEGWFTERKLGEYFNAERDDPINARQIINGNDQDTLIAGYHEKFLTALRQAVA